jgi:5-methyltetrahydrofolate--homocysteine methyltransferase
MLRELLRDRILVLDGAMGTSIQKFDLKAADFGGTHLEGCNENLLITRPDVISSIHEDYLKAGADILETNTFGTTSIVLAEYGLQDEAFALSKKGAELAKGLANKYSTSDKPRFVAGSIGPTTKSYFVTRNVTFEDLVSSFEEQTLGLLEGGADMLLVETCQDTINIKAALIGADQAMAKSGRRVPVSVSVTVETMGTMLAGQGVEALYYSLQQRDLLTIGLNCATGPDFMTDHVRTLAEISRFGVACVPNAGLPDEEGRYNESPEMIAGKLEKFVDKGWINMLGGCCGTNADHIRLISQMAAGKKPRVASVVPRVSFSGLDPFVATDEMRPIIVGERTNVIGSRLFKNMIVEEKFEEASEIARRQVRSGAQVIDVCLANPDRDELRDMEQFLDFVTRKVKAPLMIDTTDAKVLEASLKKCMGRSIVNSINLEDGEERFEKIVPVIKTYGAAVVVGCIDENKQQGMAVTRERKLSIAQRSLQLLTEKYGLEPEDIIFDPLVFPIATGDQNYVGSAEETIEGIRLIRRTLPRCKTVLGVSNVSFGLPEAGREVLNSVFLYHCVQAGLDLAIVNAEKLARYPSISEEEKKLANDLLFSTRDNNKAMVDAFAAHFRTKKTVQKVDNRSTLSIDERLPQNVVQGSKEGLVEDLNALLAQGRKPLDIVNGPLMKGMDEVGRLFGKNEMIVAEVLQSAEVMKAAVAHLEPHMSTADAAARGKIVLATVKGDVHDIGKNLVHIILKNNGFNVVDLGIKCPPEELVKAAREHKPDMLGLSGLLVKSAQMMVTTAEDLKAAGIDLPILVGGAALSEKFTAMKIAPTYGSDVFYAKDAMTGLDLANRLMENRPALVEKNRSRHAELRAAAAAVAPSAAVPAGARSKISRSYEPPLPPDLKLHVVQDFNVEDIFRYVNPVMLYGKHLGLRGRLENLLEKRDEKALKIHAAVQELQAEILAKKMIQARALWKFFPIQADGEKLLVLDGPKGGNVIETFDFPRQAKGDFLCLSDYALPRESGKVDYAAMFIVTCGEGVMELSKEWREKGDYFKSHAIQSIAIESAEGFAELLHDRLRSAWGFPDGKDKTMQDKFQTRYRGLRVSFGYPACPNLEDQAKMFKLLDPEKNIGVKLSENFMMEPEASVSALVFHHPEAHYFSVVEDGAVPAGT